MQHSCSRTHRPSAGTTVTVYELFHSRPVRGKCLSKGIELERTKHRLEAIALLHPAVSFSLKNQLSGKLLLQTHTSDSIYGAFTHLFGETLAQNLREIECSSEAYRVHGYIGIALETTSSYQLVYVNKRLVLKTRMHKLINDLLRKFAMLQPKRKLASASASNTVSSISGQCSTETYGVYVINITCPLSEYDITFDPSKTLIVFKHWSAVLECVQHAVCEFINDNNLLRTDVVCKTNNTSADVSKADADCSKGSLDVEVHVADEAEGNSASRYAKSINTANLMHTLHSNTARRQVEEVTGSVPVRSQTGADQKESNVCDVADKSNEASSEAVPSEAIPSEAIPSEAIPGGALSGAVHCKTGPTNDTSDDCSVDPGVNGGRESSLTVISTAGNSPTEMCRNNDIQKLSAARDKRARQAVCGARPKAKKARLSEGLSAIGGTLRSEVSNASSSLSLIRESMKESCNSGDHWPRSSSSASSTISHTRDQHGSVSISLGSCSHSSMSDFRTKDPAQHARKGHGLWRIKQKLSVEELPSSPDKRSSLAPFKNTDGVGRKHRMTMMSGLSVVKQKLHAGHSGLATKATKMLHAFDISHKTKVQIDTNTFQKADRCGRQSNNQGTKSLKCENETDTRKMTYEAQHGSGRSLDKSHVTSDNSSTTENCVTCDSSFVITTPPESKVHQCAVPVLHTRTLPPERKYSVADEWQVDGLTSSGMIDLTGEQAMPAVYHEHYRGSIDEMNNYLQCTQREKAAHSIPANKIDFLEHAPKVDSEERDDVKKMNHTLISPASSFVDQSTNLNVEDDSVEGTHSLCDSQSQASKASLMCVDDRHLGSNTSEETMVEAGSGFNSEQSESQTIHIDDSAEVVDWKIDACGIEQNSKPHEYGMTCPVLCAKNRSQFPVIDETRRPINNDTQYNKDPQEIQLNEEESQGFNITEYSQGFQLNDESQRFVSDRKIQEFHTNDDKSQGLQPNSELQTSDKNVNVESQGFELYGEPLGFHINDNSQGFHVIDKLQGFQLNGESQGFDTSDLLDRKSVEKKDDVVNTTDDNLKHNNQVCNLIILTM